MTQAKVPPRLAIIACSLISIAASLWGQQPEAPASDDQIPVIRASSDFVLLDTLVQDKRTGQPIPGLIAADFPITEDGVPQSITYLSQDQLPLSIVFLLDLTETVHPVLQKLAQGASMILGHLKPQDEIAVMVFSSHTELVQDFTTRRISTDAAIERAAQMKTTEGTFIDEDVYEAVDQALQSTAPQNRRVLVWLTDGTANDENSFTQATIGKESPAHLRSKSESTEKLMHSGVAVAAMIEHSDLTDSLLSAAQRNPGQIPGGARVGDIANYASLTGGPVVYSAGKSATVQLAALLDKLRSRYTLGYKPAASVPDGKFCKLRVTLSPEAYKNHPEWKKSNIEVLAKSGYYR
jgi:Ca-activated chloride channel family protein